MLTIGGSPARSGARAPGRWASRVVLMRLHFQVSVIAPQGGRRRKWRRGAAAAKSGVAGLAPMHSPSPRRRASRRAQRAPSRDFSRRPPRPRGRRGKPTPTLPFLTARTPSLSVYTPRHPALPWEIGDALYVVPA